MKIFTIIDKNTGLFSSGSSNPVFRKTGKTWTTRGSLNNHLLMMRSAIDVSKDFKTKMADWVIVEHDLVNNSRLIVGNALEFINHKEKLESVSKKYGKAASMLSDKLEKADLLSTYRWAAVHVLSVYVENKDLSKFIKSLGVAASSFRMASIDFTAAIGFSDKKDLIMFKLSYPGSFQTIDLAETSAIDLS